MFGFDDRDDDMIRCPYCGYGEYPEVGMGTYHMCAGLAEHQAKVLREQAQRDADAREQRQRDALLRESFFREEMYWCKVMTPGPTHPQYIDIERFIT